jgi:hypothetical protein
VHLSNEGSKRTFVTGAKAPDELRVFAAQAVEHGGRMAALGENDKRQADRV